MEHYYKTKMWIKLYKEDDAFEWDYSEPYYTDKEAKAFIQSILDLYAQEDIEWYTLLIYEYGSKPDNPEYIIEYDLYSDLSINYMQVSYNGMDGIWTFRFEGDDRPDAGSKYKAGDCLQFDDGVYIITSAPGLLEDADRPDRWENIYLIHKVINGVLDHDHVHELSDSIERLIEPHTPLLKELSVFLKAHPKGYRSEDFISIVHKHGVKMEGE